MSQQTSPANSMHWPQQPRPAGIDRRAFMRRRDRPRAHRSRRACASGRRTSRPQTPTKGGQFRVGLDDGNTTDSMDPATFNSRFMITMAHTHRNFLTEIAPDNRSPANSRKAGRSRPTPRPGR